MKNEDLPVVVKEESVLKKFEGDKLVEQITIVDGQITSREVY